MSASSSLNPQESPATEFTARMAHGPVKRYYAVRPERDNMYVHELPTGVCVVGLAASHPAVAGRERVERVEWEGDASAMPVAAGRKRGRGAPQVRRGALLCRVVTAGVAPHEVRAPFDGTVVERNEALDADPGLCARLDGAAHEFEGYLVAFLRNK